MAIAPYLVKTKDSIPTETSHVHCPAWWWKGDGWGLFCSHRTWAPLSLIAKVCSCWVRQQDNDLKYTSKHTAGLMENTRMQVLEWLGQSGAVYK